MIRRCLRGHRVPSLLDHLQKKTRAHISAAHASPLLLKSITPARRYCQSAHFYLQTWLEDTNKNLLNKSTCCLFSFFFFLNPQTHIFKTTVFPTDLARAQSRDSTLNPLSHIQRAIIGNTNPRHLWENHYFNIWIMHVEKRRCNNFKCQLG